MYCQHCGKELKSDARFCPVCGFAVEGIEKIYCQHCGKELENGAAVCTGCGFAVSPSASTVSSSASMDFNEFDSYAPVFFLLGLSVLILGIINYFLVNVWIGRILALAAEILFLMPWIRLQNFVKKQNPCVGKATLKLKIKAAAKAEGSHCPLYKPCYPFAVISLVILIILVFI